MKYYIAMAFISIVLLTGCGPAELPWCDDMTAESGQECQPKPKFN